jgi:hypothetical protein
MLVSLPYSELVVTQVGLLVSENVEPTLRVTQLGLLASQANAGLHAQSITYSEGLGILTAPQALLANAITYSEGRGVIGSVGSGSHLTVIT